MKRQKTINSMSCFIGSAKSASPVSTKRNPFVHAEPVIMFFASSKLSCMHVTSQYALVCTTSLADTFQRMFFWESAVADGMSRPRLFRDCNCMPIAGEAVQCLYTSVTPCNDCRDAEESSDSSKGKWAMQKEVVLKYLQVCCLCLSVYAFVNVCP